jgi:hypothetical protein
MDNADSRRFDAIRGCLADTPDRPAVIRTILREIAKSDEASGMLLLPIAPTQMMIEAAADTLFADTLPRYCVAAERAYKEMIEAYRMEPRP